MEETERELKEERKEQEERLERGRKERKEQAAKLEKGRKNHREREEKIEGTRKESKAPGIQHENEKALEKQNPSQGFVDSAFDHIMDSVDISEEGMAALEKHIALD